MKSNFDMWQAFKAERDELAEELAATAEEHKERNQQRNDRRRRSRNLGLPKRPRRTVGSPQPKKIGPKRANELAATLQYQLLRRIFARQDEINQSGIEAVLLEMLSEPPPLHRRSEHAEVEFISKDIIRRWLLEYSSKQRRPEGERMGSLWHENEIRAELNTQKKLAKSALRALPKKPISWVEWRAVDRANAQYDVLCWFSESADLSTDDEFLRLCQQIYQNPIVLSRSASLPYYQKCWREAILRLRADVTGRYVDNEAVCPPLSEGVSPVADLVKRAAVTPAAPPRTPSAPPPEEHAPAPPAEDVILLDLDGPPVKSWEDFVIVLGDNYEKKLVGRYVPLSNDADKCLYEVRQSDDPKAVGAAVKVALTAINSMLEVTAALDEHRRGSKEEIVVSLDGKVVKGEPVSQALVKADQFLDEYLMDYVSGLQTFVELCREDAKQLEYVSSTPADRRTSVDKRGLEREFLELACFITGEMARFTQAIRTRHKRAHHEILLRVDLVGMTAKPVCKEALIARKTGRPDRPSSPKCARKTVKRPRKLKEKDKR